VLWIGLRKFRMTSKPPSDAEPPANANTGYDPLSSPGVGLGLPDFSSMSASIWGGASQIASGDSASQAREAIDRGDALTAKGRFNAALAQFQEAVWLCPSSSYNHFRVAGAAETLGRYDLVERHLHESIRLECSFAPAHSALSRLYHQSGKIERAIQHSAISVALAPRNPQFVAEHGTLLVMTGQAQQAWELIESMVAAPGPVFTFIATLYARIASKFGHEEKALEVVRRTLDATTETTEREHKVRLQFAASGLLETLGRYDEAFEYARAGNELIRTFSPRHDPALSSQRTTEKIDYFTAERLLTLPRATHGNRRPVFIVGMPRSGTSLVEQILASHSEVFGGGELETLSAILNPTNTREWSPDLAYPQSLETLSARRANRLATSYLSVINAINSVATYVTDKMPLNLLNLELVELLLPGCHVIYCTRNPLDTCLSCYMTDFAVGNEYKYDLGHTGAYLRDTVRLMDHWKKTLSLPILEMRYEDLVLDTEGQSRRLLEFLKLPWEEQCLDFHRNKRVLRTASEDQVRRPIYTSSIGRWKHYEAHLGPLIAGLRTSKDA